VSVEEISYRFEEILEPWFANRPQVINVDGDGHCGFHAYGKGLRIHAFELRRQLISEIQNNLGFYLTELTQHVDPPGIIMQRLNCFRANVLSDSRKWFEVNDFTMFLAKLTRRPVIVFIGEYLERSP
jgi:hypothetical protein